MNSSGFLSDTIPLDKRRVDIFPKSFIKNWCQIAIFLFCSPLVQWIWGEDVWGCSCFESWLNQSTLGLQWPKVPPALTMQTRHHLLVWLMPNTPSSPGDSLFGSFNKQPPMLVTALVSLPVTTLSKPTQRHPRTLLFLPRRGSVLLPVSTPLMP